MNTDLEAVRDAVIGRMIVNVTEDTDDEFVIELDNGDSLRVGGYRGEGAWLALA